MAAAAAAPETSRANISPAYEVAPGWVDHLQVSKSEAIVFVRSLNASLGWDDWVKSSHPKRGLKGMIDQFMGPLLAALEGGSGENAPRRVMERLIVKVLKATILLSSTPAFCSIVCSGEKMLSAIIPIAIIPAIINPLFI